jgi:hypothetical protein
VSVGGEKYFWKQMGRKEKQSANAKPASQGWRILLSRWWVWIVLVLILAFAAGIRLRLLEMPLERDEGEYAYMGQLMLQGIPPYQSAYNMKFPGTYAAYALIMAVFGQTVEGIHFGLLLVSAGAMILILLIARKLWDAQAGLMAAAAYALMAMSQMSLGMAGHATHFVVLPMLGALLLMLNTRADARLWRHFAVGSLLGLAVLMKQPGALYIPFFAVFPLWDELRQRPIRWRAIAARLIALTLGVALILLITAAILWRAGVFEKFWYWTVVYAKAYGTQVPVARWPGQLHFGFATMAQHTWPLWLLAAAGLVLQFFDRSEKRRSLFTIGFAVFSFLAVCPGMVFRNHYFILLMPAAAMLIGGGLCALRGFMQRWRTSMAWLLPLLVFLGVWGYVFSAESNFLLRMAPDSACTSTYGTNPFIESRELGRYLQEHTSPDDKIAVLGSEPQICFYSRRRSATGYIYTYPLMEEHPDALQMQKEMAGEIEAANPRYVVFVRVRLSWLPWPRSQTWILNEWLGKYLQNYNVVGRADLLAGGSRYWWGAEAASSKPLSEEYLLIYRRK